MADYDTTVRLTLTDANGDTAVMAVPLGLVADATTMAQLATTVGSLLTGLGGPGTITNAKVTSATVSFLYEKANTSGAIDAEFSSVTDGARINFVSTSGQKYVSTIPAPIPAVFGAAPNEDVVDPGGAASAWIAAFIAHAGGVGATPALYNGGVKVGRHSRKRAQHKVA